MDTSGLSDLSSDNLATLKHLSDLLHLFNHRNKNQHRRSIWFRHFSTFRKQLNTLVQDISEIREVPETHLQRIRKVKKDVARQQRLSQRLVLWQDVMVAKWHHAFSQTITENSFAVLGIFLLAVLSQVSQIVGVTARFEELGQAEVERAIEDFGKEYWAAEDQARPRESENEDFGEVIAREEEVMTPIVSTPINAAIDASPAPEREDQQPRTKVTKRKQTERKGPTPSRKKQKKRNPIDFLFGGVL